MSPIDDIVMTTRETQLVPINLESEKKVLIQYLQEKGIQNFTFYKDLYTRDFVITVPSEELLKR